VGKVLAQRFGRAPYFGGLALAVSLAMQKKAGIVDIAGVVSAADEYRVPSSTVHVI
jgi:hypothetical protein